MPQSCKVTAFAYIVSFLAVSEGSLYTPPRLWNCALNDHSNSQDHIPGFSSCARNHYTTASGTGNSTWPYREYVSSDARPPWLQINRTERPLSSGLIFITPQEFSPVINEEVPAAIIMKDDGDMIWRESSTTLGAMIVNLRRQNLHDKPVITFWNGTEATTHGYGAGAVEVLNDRYEKIHSICPRLDVSLNTPENSTVKCYCDFHESLITPDNTMLVTVYNQTTADLSSVGGPKTAVVIDSLVVEVDIQTNKPIFIWSPLEHVPVRDSHRPIRRTGTLSEPYDWFHANSVQLWGDGLLINSRHTWTTYYVSRTGEIQWRINGETGGDFGVLPENGHFSWQHDARLHSCSGGQLELTYFANNEMTYANPSSVALSLLLDMSSGKQKPPVLLKNLSDPVNPVFSRAGGSHMILPNGNRFVGYGDRPVLKEFGPEPSDGSDVRWSAQLPYTRHSYRAYKQDWHGTPSTPPNLVVRRRSPDDGLNYCAGISTWRGFVSWNGATDVVQYAIYVDFGDGEMERFDTVPKQGFETEFVIPIGVSRVRITALECAEGCEAGRSTIVSVG